MGDEEGMLELCVQQEISVIHLRMKPSENPGSAPLEEKPCCRVRCRKSANTLLAASWGRLTQPRAQTHGAVSRAPRSAARGSSSRNAVGSVPLRTPRSLLDNELCLGLTELRRPQLCMRTGCASIACYGSGRKSVTVQQMPTQRRASASCNC